MGANRLSQTILPNGSSYNLSVPFIIGTGSTAGTWLGELEGLTEYYDGLLILYKPSVAGANPTTLNINSLGAKTCYANNTSKLTTHFPVNQPILLSYSTSQNSGCWISVNNYWDGNDISTVRPYYTHFWAYNNGNGIKQYSLFAKTYTGSASNGYSSFSTDSGTGTKTYDLTIPFDIRKIYYANRSSNLAANSYMGDNQVTFSINLVDARYTLNCAKTLTANYSVYLMFNKHNDADPPGYYRLNSSIYTQTPSDQNCIYVLIGIAYDTYRVDLLMHNQAYRFNGTTLVPFNPGDVDTITGHTVDKDVPSDAVFTDTNNRKSFYGTCDTAAATAAKVITLVDTDGWELKAGTIIGVKFTNSNRATNVTLNVNGSGAKSIYYGNAVFTGADVAMTGSADGTIYYMYNGTYWVWFNYGKWQDTDTKVAQYLSSSDVNRPLLLSYANNTNSTDPVTNSVIRNNSIYANPSTGKITTNSVGVGGTAATMQYNSTTQAIEFVFS